MISTLIALSIVVMPLAESSHRPPSSICQHIAPQLREAVKRRQISQQQAMETLLRCILYHGEKQKTLTT